MRKTTVFFAVYVVVLQGVFLLLASLREHDALQKVVVFLSGTIILCIALLCMKILKRIFRKHRQYKDGTLFIPKDSYAFPSGHATGIATLVTYIFDKNVEIGIIALCFGALVVASRVMSHVHDIVDVIGGIVLGVSITLLLIPVIEPMVYHVISTHMFLS